jgi:hypothetical protein
MVLPNNLYTKLNLIKSLPLPDDINNVIKVDYKYKMLEKKYRQNMETCINEITYYEFLKNKLNRKFKTKDTLLKTIKMYEEALYN